MFSTQLIVLIDSCGSDDCAFISAHGDGVNQPGSAYIVQPLTGARDPTNAMFSMVTHSVMG